MSSRRKAKDDAKKPLRMAVRADIPNGLVQIEFDKAIATIGLEPNNARQFAALLIRKANECVRPS